MRQVTLQRTKVTNHEGLNQYDVLEHRADKDRIQFLHFIPEDNTFTCLNVKTGKMSILSKHPFNVGYALKLPAIDWNAPLRSFQPTGYQIT